ncbi:uncharacterized protein LOC120301132 [Crotalus tigris]|uniref:uncharacterized protein LOC120301132 n=1 Tax=Crotalus tigris TaxID=88082 RepID=UPI00192F1876|nr:uncharacterized protein LOC120301132 [Crotalus tigris]
MEDNTASQSRATSPSSSVRKRHRSPSQEAAGGITAKVRPKAASGGKTSKLAERQASRRHQALEKEFEKAQKQARAETAQTESTFFDLPLGLADAPQEVWAPAEPSSSYDQAEEVPEVQAFRSPHTPEATFTPTAAGLRGEELTLSALDDRIQALVDQAVERALTIRTPLVPRAESLLSIPLSCPVSHSSRDPPSPSYSFLSGVSATPEQDQALDASWSEEEEPIPDPPPFGGLFNPSLFLPLLRKVSSVPHGRTSQPAPGAPSTDPEADPVFIEPVATQHHFHV